MSGDYPDWTGLAQIIGTDIMVAIDVQGGYIMLPVDIQAQYITLDIDIVAQTVGNIAIDIKAQTLEKLNINIAASAVTLDVNLKSQTANINVNIAASAITLNMNLQSSSITLNVNISSQTANLNVDIKASSVTLTVSVSGTAQIDIETQSVGIYLQPDWQALQGNDKNLLCDAANQGRDGSATAEYEIPGGSTFFVCGFSGSIWAYTPTDYDHHLVCQVRVMEKIGAVYYHRAMIGGNGGAGLTLPKPITIEAGNKVVVQIWNLSNIACDMRAALWGYEV